jgi:hypothetical protein
MGDSKLFIGALVVIGGFVAIAWFGWFGPAQKTLSAVKNNSVSSNSNQYQPSGGNNNVNSNQFHQQRRR